MIDLADPPRARRSENLVPLINVVFLLLIFFLISATIAGPEPFEIEAPTAQGDAAPEGVALLYLSSDGRLAFDGARGEAVFAALARHVGRSGGMSLTLRADRAADGAEVAALLRRLADVGVERVHLVAMPQGDASGDGAPG